MYCATVTCILELYNSFVFITSPTTSSNVKILDCGMLHGNFKTVDKCFFHSVSLEHSVT